VKGIQLSAKSASDREAQPTMPTSSLKEVRASYAGKWDDRSFVKQTGDYLSVNGILKTQEWTAGDPSAPQINTLSSKLTEIDETNCDGMLVDDVADPHEDRRAQAAQGGVAQEAEGGGD